jgi:hypothetical protein
MGLLNNLRNQGKGAGTEDNEYLGLRIFIGGTVVAVALLALVISLNLVLDSYDVQQPSPATAKEPTGGVTAATSVGTSSASASSVVAVLSPVVAGIVGLAGLFFGISATGSTRGTEAETERREAAAAEKKAAAELEEKQDNQLTKKDKKPKDPEP